MSIPTSVEAVGDASFEMAIKQALQETMFLNALGINPVSYTHLDVYKRQPFNRLIGAELIAFRSGYAELSIGIQPDLLQQHGSVHGGVLSYAADNALTFAGGSVLGPHVVTAGYTINYLKAARSGSLTARASVVSKTTRQAVCRLSLIHIWPGQDIR